MSLVGKLPPALTGAQSDALRERVAAGDADALAALVNGHLRLVTATMWKYRRKGIDDDELFSLGCVGLMYAIRNYDPTRNMTLASYVALNVKGRIRNAFRDMNNHPEHFGTISLDAPAYRAHGKSRADGKSAVTGLEMLADKSTSVLDRVETNDTASRILEEIDKLPAEMRTVLTLRYTGECQLSQRAVSEITGMSQMTVSRREKAAIERCRAAIAGADTQERSNQ